MEQDTVILYDDHKVFNFKLKKSLVKGGMIYFQYQNSDGSSRLVTLGRTTPDQQEVKVELSSQSTFETDMFMKKAQDLVKADGGNVNLAKIEDLANNFKVDEYLPLLDFVGGYEGYTDGYLSFEDARPVLEALANKATEEEIRQEVLLNSRSVKMICDSLEKITFSGKSSKSKGFMSFEVRSEEDKIALGADSSTFELGETGSNSEATELLANFKYKMRVAANLSQSPINGTVHFLNRHTGIESKCALSVMPEEFPVADNKYFEDFKSGLFESFLVAWEKLKYITDQTKTNLKNIYTIQGIIDSPELDNQNKIIDGWYQASLEDIKQQFSSQGLKADLKPLEEIIFSKYPSVLEAQKAIDTAKEKSLQILLDDYNKREPNEDIYRQQVDVIEKKSIELSKEKEAYFTNLPPLLINTKYLDAVVFSNFTNRKAAYEAFSKAINNTANDFETLFILRGGTEIDIHDAQRNILDSMKATKSNSLHDYFNNLDTVKADEKYYLALNFNSFATFNEAKQALINSNDATKTDLTILNDLDQNYDPANFALQLQKTDIWYVHYNTLMQTIFTNRCNALAADLTYFESVDLQVLTSEIAAINALEVPSQIALTQLRIDFEACGKITSTQFEIESKAIKTKYDEKLELAKQYFIPN